VSKPRRQRIIAGMALIVMGLGLFWLHRVEGIGQAAGFFLIGGVFLAAYLYNRSYGFLIPAGILIGLGAGSVGAETFFSFGESHLLGLGCGFVGIYLVSLLYERRGHWWPLIPGIALILLGLPNTERIFRYLGRNWPLILVIIGVMILLGAFGRPKSRRGSSADG
jgi:hypothetical protein